jgi:hypothetical protein
LAASFDIRLATAPLPLASRAAADTRRALAYRASTRAAREWREMRNRMWK